MKKYTSKTILLVGIIGMINAFTLSAQEHPDADVQVNEKKEIKGDTTKFSIMDKKVLIIDAKDTTKADSATAAKPKKKKVKDIWSGFELGVAGYFTPQGSTVISGKYDFLNLDYRRSTTINLNVIEKHVKLYQQHIALTTGLGFQFNRYMFDGASTLQPHSDSTWAILRGIDYKKNALKTSYVTVPLFLQFTSGKKHSKSFHLAAGVIGGYRLSTHTKQVFSLDGRKHKENVYDDFNLAPYYYAASVRAGYAKLNIFGTYGLSSLFRKNKGPELYPFTVGISLIH